MSKHKIQRVLNILTLSAAVFFTLLLLLAIPAFLNPEFTLSNRSNQKVFVTAEWRDQSLDLGMIKPQGLQVFDVDDEAAMRFKVRYADGRQVESEPIYFSSGINVIVVVSDDAVSAKYDFEN